MGTEFRLFGAVAAYKDGGPLELGPPMQRALLAVLLLEANRVVTPSRLELRLWAHPPPRARKSLHSYIARLRRATVGLDEVAIERCSGGYVMRIDRSQVDVHRFRDLLVRAHSAPHDRLHLLEEAIRISTGELLSGMSLPGLGSLRADLAARRAGAILDRNDVLLESGDQAAVLSELAADHDAWSMDERRAAQYMTALCHAGRQFDALTEYQRIRTLLIERLGSEPGPVLRDLQRTILSGAMPMRHDSGRRPVPRQLPPVPTRFRGRRTELSRLDSHIGSIGMVSGAGGIGKTWLVTHWAHREIDRFPDGQLYLNLHGFDAATAPVTADAALLSLLDALGVAHAAIPGDLNARSGLFRSLVADRRMLLVLDNVRDFDQVEPLLPGSPEVTTIVISRHRLPALVTAHGAGHVTPGPMEHVDGLSVLAASLDDDRTSTEPGAAADLVAYCGGLPLALGIIAARAATRPELPLTELVAELRDRESRLSALNFGEVSVGLRTTIETSLQAVDPAAVRLFGLWGAAPAKGLRVAAVASLGGIRVPEARRLLMSLEDANLLQRDRTGRYLMHDLLHLYASERVATDDATDALRRLVDHYTMGGAYRMRHFGYSYAPGEFVDGVTAPDVDDGTVSGWMTEEYETIRFAMRAAARYSWYTGLWVTASMAFQVQVWTGRLGGLDESVAYFREAADNLADPALNSRLERILGAVMMVRGNVDGALTRLHRAAEGAARAGDRIEQLATVYEISEAHAELGHFSAATRSAATAVSLLRRGDSAMVAAVAHNAMGSCLARVGDLVRAEAHCRHAMRLLGPDPDPRVAGFMQHSIAGIARDSGDTAGALEAFNQAVALFESADAHLDRAAALVSRAEVHRGAARFDAARRDYSAAVQIYRDSSMSEKAAEIQTEVASLPRSPT